MDDFFSLIDFSFLDQIGDNPFAAMWFLFTHGGWILVAYFIGWAALHVWVEHKQEHFEHKKQWILLSIQVPRMTEQTPRAVENIFAHWAGAHSPNSWTEQWILGRTQDKISIEIVSIEGRVQFLVYTTRNFRDLIEASIFAQYPDAEIAEIEDYTKKVPHNYPDKDWDLFMTEMIPVKKPTVYPLRTYPEFEDKVSGEFKDPLAVLLENFARLGPGEQAWMQIVLTPIDQVGFREQGEEEVRKISGIKGPEPKHGMVDAIFDIPLHFVEFILEGMGLKDHAYADDKKDQTPFNAKMFNLTPGERLVLEALERKIAKIAYLVKIRFVFAAKKEIMRKSRIVHPFIGAMKQFNTNNMQSIKPESKKVGSNSTLWLFKERRNNERKTRFIKAFSARSNWFGTPNWFMNIEELATMWHFPNSMQVKAPQLHKTDAKRAEPPMNLPFG